MLTSFADLRVGDLVLENPGRARVFEKHGIDYCCGGRQSLDAACRTAGASVEDVCDELEAIDSMPATAEPAWSQMSLSELVDHIVSHHHAYLRAEFPRLDALLVKVAAAHGDGHPELETLKRTFRAFVPELQMHMIKEERILFPIIKALETASRQQIAPPIFHFGSVNNPIRGMMHEHLDAGDALEAMSKLTHQFTPPVDACPSYRALLEGLRELEMDMHLHIHKENNLLFPRASELEASLGNSC